MMIVYFFLIVSFVIVCFVLMIIKDYVFLFIHLVAFLGLYFCHLVDSLDLVDLIDEDSMKDFRIGIDLLKGCLDGYMYTNYFDKDLMNSTLSKIIIIFYLITVFISCKLYINFIILNLTIIYQHINRNYKKLYYNELI